jgi:hypothetical protein
MIVDGPNNRFIEGVDGTHCNAAIISQRGVDREPTANHHRCELLEPVGRYKIKQRKARNQIDRSLERSLEFAAKIEYNWLDANVRKRHPRRAREQGVIVVE